MHKQFSQAFHCFSNLVIKMKIIADKRHLQYLQQKENSSKHFRKRRKIQNLRSLTIINKFSNFQNYNLIIHFANRPKKQLATGRWTQQCWGCPKREAIKNACPEGLTSRLPQREQAPQCKSLNEIRGGEE